MADVNSCRSLCVVSHEEASDAVDLCFLLRSLLIISGSSTVAPMHYTLAEVIIRAAKNLPTGSERCPSRSQIAKPAGPAGWKRLLFQGGVGLLAASCVVLILVAAVAKVQDAADRTH